MSHLSPRNIRRQTLYGSASYQSLIEFPLQFDNSLDQAKVRDVHVQSGEIENDSVKSKIIDFGLNVQKDHLFLNRETQDVVGDEGIEKNVASDEDKDGKGWACGSEVIEEENKIMGRDTAANGNSNNSRVFLGHALGHFEKLLDLDDGSFSLENDSQLGILEIENDLNGLISFSEKQSYCHEDKLQNKSPDHEALNKFNSLDHNVPSVVVSGDRNVDQVHKESDATTKTTQSDVPEAEFSIIVQESSDDKVKNDMQVDSANVSVISGANNSDVVPSDVNLEDGEIPDVFGDVDPSSHSQNDHFEIEEHIIEDMSNTYVESKNIASRYVMEEDKIASHDLTKRIDSRNASSSIVDYSDLYSSNHAFKKTKSSNLPNLKKGGTQTKKDDGHKLLPSVPKFDKCRNNTTEKDDCHKLLLLPPKDGRVNSLTLTHDNFDVAVRDNISLPEVFSEKMPNMDLQKESNSENDEFTEKKKRKKGPMTEGRKAKKKAVAAHPPSGIVTKESIIEVGIIFNKKHRHDQIEIQRKRKRAELNRKLGIKRLKIEPFSMPKKVVYCEFYLNGRCQKGASCNFSHDTTPLTKSQPCKYFACDSCLKGEDCQFDHDLWKYPCHNFTSSGTCIRGETCKFSHKVQINPVENADKKQDMLNLSERTTIRDTNASIFPKAVKNSPMNPRSNALNVDNTGNKPSADHLPGTISRVIPKGITFLSFGKNTPEKHTKSDKKSQLEKHSNSIVSSNANSTPTNTAMDNAAKGINSITLDRNESKDVKSLGDKFFKSSDVEMQPTLTPKMPSVALSTGVVKFSDFISDSGNKEALTTKEASKSSSQSEASKILEEFLFCDSF